METLTSLTLLLMFCKGNTLAPYLFIICHDIVHRTSIEPMKETVFALKTITDAGYADDILLLVNILTQVESLLNIQVKSS